MQIIRHSGYPDYFPLLLGAAKILGALALAVPNFPRLKEWAYAGLFYDFFSAFVSHFIVKDNLTDIITPLIFIAVLMISYFMYHQKTALNHDPRWTPKSGH